MISRATKPVLAACAAILALAACSSGADADGEDIPTVPVATAAPGGDSTSDTGTQSDDKPQVSETGDVEGTLGTPVGLSNEDESIFSLTVDSIEHADTCPSRLDPADEVSPEKTSFLVVDMTATMAADFEDHIDEGEETFLVLAADAFYLTDENGVIEEEVITVASYECFSIEELVNPAINPGQETSGVIALDTDLEHGYLVYNPWGVDGSGWRWAF